jgi:hypothetical protein
MQNICSLSLFISSFFLLYVAAVKQSNDPEKLRPWMREVLVAPKPKRVGPGVIRYEKSYERTNKNTGEHLSLRYTSERSEDEFINLDLEPELFGVDCEDEVLILHASNSFPLSEFVKNNTGRLIYGGIKWECQIRDQGIGPFFRSITSIPVIRNDTNNLLSITIQVQDASPFSFFGRYTRTENIELNHHIRKIVC